MKGFGSPILFVFAFTVLVCVASLWWLLRGRRERADPKRSTRPLQAGERSAAEVLRAIPSTTISLAQHGAVTVDSVGLDKKGAPGQILRREETRSRLALLSDLIAKQNLRIASARTKGLDIALLEEQLKILTDSREEYYSALKRLLLDSTDCENAYRGDQWPV